MQDSAYIVYCEKQTKLIEKIAEIGMPRQGQQIRLITRRTFNAIQFLQYICETETIISLKIAIYSINYYAAKILIGLIDTGHIHQADILKKIKQPAQAGFFMPENHGKHPTTN